MMVGGGVTAWECPRLNRQAGSQYLPRLRQGTPKFRCQRTCTMGCCHLQTCKWAKEVTASVRMSRWAGEVAGERSVGGREEGESERREKAERGNENERDREKEKSCTVGTEVRANGVVRVCVCGGGGGLSIPECFAFGRLKCRWFVLG